MEWRTSNPTMKAFEGTWADEDATVMTVRGAMMKTSILGAFVFLTAAVTWSKLASGVGGVAGAHQTIYGLAVGGSLVGLLLSFIIYFAPKVSPFLAPAYAGVQGAVIGGVSAWIDQRLPGIAIQALGITVGTLCSMGIVYQAGLLRATDTFKRVVITATCGIALLYMMSMLMRIFGMQMPFLHQTGPIGIGISLFILTIAALNLILDFDYIEEGARSQAPKYMEWYAAFSLLVTIVWIYWEALRLLSKLRGRD